MYDDLEERAREMIEEGYRPELVIQKMVDRGMNYGVANAMVTEFDQEINAGNEHTGEIAAPPWHHNPYFYAALYSFAMLFVTGIISGSRLSTLNWDVITVAAIPLIVLAAALGRSHTVGGLLATFYLIVQSALALKPDLITLPNLYTIITGIIG